MFKRPLVSSVVSTVLFAGTLGVLIAVASFGVLRIGESMLEALGYLPLRWGENNVDVLMTLSLLLSLPVVAWFVVWFYKKAIVAEEKLVGYEYHPPKE
jgi:hypothetical protein